MATLLGLKRYEMRTGRVFFMQVRPRVGEFFSRSLLWVEHTLPELLARELRRLYSWARAGLRALTARAIILTEHLLEKSLHGLRRKTDAPHRAGEASAFLREVAEHKKKLMQDRAEDAEE